MAVLLLHRSTFSPGDSRGIFRRASRCCRLGKSPSRLGGTSCSKRRWRGSWCGGRRSRSGSCRGWSRRGYCPRGLRSGLGGAPGQLFPLPFPSLPSSFPAWPPTLSLLLFLPFPVPPFPFLLSASPTLSRMSLYCHCRVGPLASTSAPPRRDGCRQASSSCQVPRASWRGGLPPPAPPLACRAGRWCCGDSPRVGRWSWR